MKKIVTMVLFLLSLSIFPIYVHAETYVQEGKSMVSYSVPAKITFQNEDKTQNIEIEVGEKLKEPLHKEIDSYVFTGWYNGDDKWDFENDVVTDHMTLVAKYVEKDSFNINVKVDKESIMKPSILNEIDLGKEFEGVVEGDNVDIILEVKDASKIITETDKNKFERVINENNLVLGKYIDISLFMEINGDVSTRKNIHETKNKAKIELTIPEEIRENGRKYYLLRLHNGNIETVHEGFPTKDWKLTFETDKFSLYAIAYSEEEYTNINVNTPKTGDIIMLWVSLLIISSFGIVSMVMLIKKKK